ncbi:MAG: ATP-binding protein, partial [Desulfobacterales bacterium]
EKEFFLRYPRIGFSEAFRMYGQESSRCIAEVVSLSAHLQKALADTDASDALRKSDVNLNFYLSASDRYSLVFLQAVSLVEKLAGKDQLQDQLQRHADMLEHSPEIQENSAMLAAYREMRAFEKDYLITRQRPFMQSAFNIAAQLRKSAQHSPQTDSSRKQQFFSCLDRYLGTAEEILAVDAEIHSRVREFDLQAEALDPISMELISLSGQEVENARREIAAIYRWMTGILMGAALVGLSLTLVIFRILDQTITRNIIRLTDAAAAIQNGDTSVRAQISTGDELGRLAGTFNEMAARLHAMIHHLEQKVSMRTAELREEIRERKRAEAEMKTAKEEAEKASRIKSEFLANMSHEIRTPMNSIIGFAEILTAVITDSQQKEYLAAISSSGKMLLHLINDILDLSKVEAGKMELVCAPVCPARVLRETARIFSHEIYKKQLDFFVETDPNLPSSLLLDETRLRQILFNLLGNAVKFTEKGSVSLSVRAEPAESDLAGPDEKESVRLIIAVKDTGIGIPEDEHAHIFDIFAQSSGNHSQGTGLGLPITKRLAEMMGGRIRVESAPGRGSVFTVTFDRVAVTREKEPQIPDADDPELPEIAFEPATVLIADDTEDNRKLISSYLKSCNLNILEAADGGQAVELAEKCRPDIVLMDMKMPKISGYQAVEKIRQHPDLAIVPIIAVTASAMKNSEKRIRALCDAYLRKPVGRQELLREMSRFLPHRVHARPRENPEDRNRAACLFADKPEGESLQHLRTLLGIMKGELSRKWQEMSETMFIDGIEEIARQAEELGKTCQWPPLLAWAGELASRAAMFDVENLSNAMKKFPDLVREVEKLIPE